MALWELDQIRPNLVSHLGIWEQKHEEERRREEEEKKKKKKKKRKGMEAMMILYGKHGTRIL